MKSSDSFESNTEKDSVRECGKTSDNPKKSLTLESLEEIEKQYNEGDAINKSTALNEDILNEIENSGDQSVVNEKDIEKASLSKSMETSYRETIEAEHRISPDVKESVMKTGGHIEGYDYRIKQPDSYKRKVENDVWDKGVSEKEALANINDAVRYTEVSDGDELVSNYEKTVAALESKGYEVVQIKNTWNNTGSPYKGVNTVLKDPAGYNFEIQYHTPESYGKKEEIHRIYEEWRKIDTEPKRKKELKEQMFELTKDLKPPEDIEKIKNRRKS